MPQALVIDLYHIFPRVTLHDVQRSSWNIIRWTDQGFVTTDLFKIWSPGKSADHLWTVEEVEPVSSHVQDVARPIGKAAALEDDTAKFLGPLRLFDCEDECLKDQKTYLSATHGVAPEYIVVSQVWGDAKVLLSLPTIEWPVPITNPAKWDAILGYCRREKVKWLWMDILCINQADSAEADKEKDTEIPKMGLYYKQAAACLVVPQNYVDFSTSYNHLMDLYSTIIETSQPVDSNALRIWESIASVDVLMSDQWFWRMWTFQELLLPRRHVLLDGQVLDLKRLRNLLDWYHKILRSGALVRPTNGRNYDYIRPDDETVITKNWRPEKLGWDLKAELEANGCVDLITLVAQTRDKGCKVQVDRLLGLYGLLNDEDMVPIKTVPENPSHPSASLIEMWKETVCKAVLSGKVWPLLHNLMNHDPEESIEGEKWIPEITALHRRGDAIDAYPETLDHRNTKRITITVSGLEISVRVIGQVVGTSASLGDGGGENNKLFTCTWLLKAKGFNIDPIMLHLKDGLEDSDSVTSDEVKDMQSTLESALSASSLGNCFYFFEEKDLRRKLAYARGVAGWDRTVLGVQIEGQSAPMVCLAWTHRDIPLAEGKCWVLDVTSDPISKVRRWVVANQIGTNVFRKIGTLRSYPKLVKEDLVRTADIVFC